MRARYVAIALLLATPCIPLLAQETLDEPPRKMNLVSFNPLGPLAGIYQGSYERAVGDSISIGISPMYMNLRLSLLALILPSDFVTWSVSAGVTVSYYLAHQAPTGLYLLGGVDAGHLSVSYLGEGAEGVLVTPHVGVGYRFIWGNFAVAPQVGVGYNLALFDYSGLPGYNASGPVLLYGLGMAIAF